MLLCRPPHPEHALHHFEQSPMSRERVTLCRHRGTGLTGCLPWPHRCSGTAQGTTCPRPAGTSKPTAWPCLVVPPHPTGSASTQLVLRLPRESFPALPTRLVCPPFIFQNFFFFLRQIIQLKKSPSIETCLTSSCLSKTMTFSPL